MNKKFTTIENKFQWIWIYECLKNEFRLNINEFEWNDFDCKLQNFHVFFFNSYAKFLRNKNNNNKHVDLTMNEMICQWFEYWSMNAFIDQYLFINKRTTLIDQCSSLINQRTQWFTDDFEISRDSWLFFSRNLSSSRQLQSWSNSHDQHNHSCRHMQCCWRFRDSILHAVIFFLWPWDTRLENFGQSKSTA